jgi:O-antigen/teichoic acid export membrane protein
MKTDLKRKSIFGAVNKFLSNGISLVLSLGSTVILARLLTPKEFGLIAMVTAFTEFAKSFGEIGLGTSTVQREKTNHDEVSALFWINMGVGLSITALIMCCTPLIAWFYNDHRVIKIGMVLSCVFIFSGLTVQHRALLERQMRFGALGAVNIIASALSIGVAIILAFKGSSVWALVFRDLTFALFYASGMWLFSGWIPGIPKRGTNIRSSLKFGAQLSGFDIIQYLSKSLDRILIGKFSGANALGLYTKSSQIAMMPIEQIKLVFWDIGFSPLSALQNAFDRFRNFYTKMISVMTFMYMPIIALFAIQAEDIVCLVLGKSWISAAPYFRLFAIAGFFRPLIGTFYLVMIACGKPKRVILWGLVNTAISIVAIAIGVWWGAIGIASAIACASFVLLAWSLRYCFKDTPVNTLLVIKTISMPVISTIAAGLVLWVVVPYLPFFTPFPRIICGIIIMTGAYLICWVSLPKSRRSLREYRSYIIELFKKKTLAQPRND